MNPTPKNPDIAAMSNDHLQFRGIISTLPEADQDAIYAKAEEIRQVIRSSRFGVMAFSLVGLELQDETLIPKIL